MQEAVKEGKINIQKIDTKQYQADILTKPLNESIYQKRVVPAWLSRCAKKLVTYTQHILTSNAQITVQIYVEDTYLTTR